MEEIILTDIRRIVLAGFILGLVFCIMPGLSVSIGNPVNDTGMRAGGEVRAEISGPAIESGAAPVIPDLPVADFSAKGGTVTRFSVFFDGTLSEGRDLNYQWGFDDESILATATPVKFFEGPYSGLVTLRVSNPVGSSSITKRVIVGNEGRVTLEPYQEPSKETIKLPGTIATPPGENATARGSGDYLDHYLEGGRLMEQGDFSGAATAFNESIRLNQSFSEAYPARAMANFLAGYYRFYEFRGEEELTRALDDFSSVIQQDPENTPAFLGRGATWIYLGEYHSWRSYIGNDSVFRYYEAAARDFNRVLEADPDNIDALNGRAYATLVIGSGNLQKRSNDLMVENARRDVERSLRLNSTNPRAHFILGLYYDHEGLYPMAIEEFSRAIEQDPGEAWYYEWRGFEKFQKGDYADAIRDYSSAIAIQPRFAQAYNIRGMTRALLMNVEDRSPELSDFNRAIEINSGISEFYRNYALTLASWKYWDRSLNEHAVDLLAKAAVLDPTDYRIFRDRAYLLTALNRNHEATVDLIRFQQRSLTNEEKVTANDLLAYNNVEPWYSNMWG